MRINHWMKYVRLDEVAECMDVSDEMRAKLWSLIVEEPQFEYPDQKFESANILWNHRGRFSASELNELAIANRKYDVELTRAA